MVKCPKCGTEIAKPNRRLVNSYFNLSRYVCPKCGYSFTVENQHIVIDLKKSFIR